MLTCTYNGLTYSLNTLKQVSTTEIIQYLDFFSQPTPADKKTKTLASSAVSLSVTQKMTSISYQKRKTVTK